MSAYNDIASQAPPQAIAGDLVGSTLIVGVYKSTGPIGLRDSHPRRAGDPNSVFIFQVAGTLITASARKVTLTNGPRACNVFWQVAESATLGTDSGFTGCILSLASVTVTTNTVVGGRALARTAGAVTLGSNVFTTTSCDVITDEDDFDLDADDDNEDDNGSGNRHGRGSELASTGAGRLEGPLVGVGGALLILGSGAVLLGRRKPAYRPKHR